MVIGAGLAGLVAIKSCLEEGLEVQAFESAQRLGGNWQFKEDGVSVFRYTELTSSTYLTAFSDFPAPEHFPHFMLHDQYLDYLLAYARRFDLERHVQFGSHVTAIRRSGAKWRVQVACTGVERSFECDAIAVCTGLNEEKNLPADETIQEFRGDIVHSSAYKDSGPYRGRKVVIVGGGESGGDILDEVSRVATQTTLSLRRGVFVMPKLDALMTLPGDWFHHRSTYHLPPAVYGPIETAFQAVFDLVGGDRRAWEFRRPLISLSGGSYHQQFITKSDTFCHALTRPSVVLKPGIERFGRDGVFFTDGSNAKADAVIYCSGFKVSFPFLPIDSTAWDWRDLYKKIFHPQLPGVGFVGFARPHIGAIPPVTELQARYFAGVASGRLSLPSQERMRSIIERDARKTTRQKPLVCERITSVVSFIPYMYELADLIGCRPKLRRLLRRPVVWWSVLFGTVAPPHFRLCGPHASEEAAAVIERGGLHLRRLKTPVDKLVFVGLQLVWGVSGILGYPVFKLVSFLPGLRFLKPEVDF